MHICDLRRRLGKYACVTVLHVSPYYHRITTQAGSPRRRRRPRRYSMTQIIRPALPGFGQFHNAAREVDIRRVPQHE
jgi:hypothetical protein